MPALSPLSIARAAALRPLALRIADARKRARRAELAVRTTPPATPTSHRAQFNRKRDSARPRYCVLAVPDSNKVHHAELLALAPALGIALDACRRLLGDTPRRMLSAPGCGDDEHGVLWIRPPPSRLLPGLKMDGEPFNWIYPEVCCLAVVPTGDPIEAVRAASMAIPGIMRHW
jgi:hypothetical protein